VNRTTEPELLLLRALAAAARGARRDGTFAVWLAVRVATDLAREGDWAERAHRRRLQALERRLTSLSLPPMLRRAMAGTLAQFREATPEGAALGVAQLVAPVRESLGAEAGEAVRRVAATLRGR